MAKVTITFTDKGSGIEIIASPKLSQLISAGDDLTSAEACAAWALKMILEQQKKHAGPKSPLWTPTVNGGL